MTKPATRGLVKEAQLQIFVLGFAMCVACGVLQLFPRLLLKVNQIGTVSESIDASLLHLPMLSCDVVQNSDLIVISGSQAVQDQWLGRYVPAPRHISRDSELASDLVLRCSHRSGETEDTTIADLAVGLCTGQKLDSKIDGRTACRSTFDELDKSSRQVTSCCEFTIFIIRIKTGAPCRSDRNAKYPGNLLK